MSEGRSFLGSAAVDGRVFMIGGCLNEENSTTEVWDPNTGTFQYIAKEPTSHHIQAFSFKTLLSCMMVRDAISFMP